MEVILLQDVANLGIKDDIVVVKNGYAQNFLIPKGMATLATPSAKKVLAENIKQRAHKEAKLLEEAQALAAKMEGLVLTIAAKASETGKIFGSVTNIQVAEALSAKGFEIDRRVITLAENIKELGKFPVNVRLHREVVIPVEVEVVAE